MSAHILDRLVEDGRALLVLKETVDDSNAALAKMRLKSPNNLGLTIHILSSDVTLRLGTGIMLLTEPIERYTRNSLTAFHTKRGCKEYLIGRANRVIDSSIKETLSIFTSEKFWAEVGFLQILEVLSNTCVCACNAI